MNVLDPQLNIEPFTPEEDEIILRETSSMSLENEETKLDSSQTTQTLTQTTTNSERENIFNIGVNWSSIASLLPGRTDNQILRRWKELNGNYRFRIYLPNFLFYNR